MADKLVYITDRSAAETDDACGERFYWNRKFGGRGIVPKEEALALMIGRETHLDLKAIAEADSTMLTPFALKQAVDQITQPLTVEDRTNQARMELMWRRLGWMVAFALYIEPQIRDRYTTLKIENELVLNCDPLFVACTPDRVLMEGKTGKIIYKEYKTTISAGKKWQDSWLYAIQLHIGLAALNDHLTRPASYAQIMGLQKGAKSYVDGRLIHPYVWGWYNEKRNEWETSYEKARGDAWSPMPIWEYPGGIVEWVQRCGEEIAIGQFPHSAPVFLNESMLLNWLHRRTAREKLLRITESMWDDPETHAMIFERRTSKCRPPFGDACPYLGCCWNAAINADPMRSGLYTERTPHHEAEINGISEED